MPTPENEPFKVVGGFLYVFCADVDRMRVEVGQYLRYCHVDKRVDVYFVDVLVVDDVQQVV